MKFNELTHMMQKPEPKPDTYEAGMALNQLLKIGTHAIKIHNMIDDDAEMESWVAKKIDLASNYVKSVHGYTAGSKAGTYDDGGMTEDAGSLTDEQKQGLTLLAKKYSGRKGVNGDPLIRGWIKARSTTGVTSDGWDSEEVKAWEKRTGKELSDWSPEDDKQFINQNEISRDMEDELLKVMGDPGFADKPIADEVYDFLDDSMESVEEDAGEGHMSKSQLYQTAKMSIELLDMIKKGDDLEGWVQTKLNLAADYLQAVYHYEDYQKLNPYREELDGELMQKHAGIIQKHLDEILERKCRAEDVDTKPGMMRILKKRVNEVEKEIAKENRKESQETTEAVELEEGIKEWGKRLAMAGVIVAGLEGDNSINSDIDNSIPAIKAMNTALEMAQDSGNDELAKMIEKDLSDAKVRLNSGRDLSHVADLQDKYAKFMKTEGLAYESKLAVALKQQLK